MCSSSISSVLPRRCHPQPTASLPDVAWLADRLMGNGVPPAARSQGFDCAGTGRSRDTASAGMKAPCPLRVISGHCCRTFEGPLYPRKRTSPKALVMSAKCQKRTSRVLFNETLIHRGQMPVGAMPGRCAMGTGSGCSSAGRGKRTVKADRTLAPKDRGSPSFRHGWSYPALCEKRGRHPWIHPGSSRPPEMSVEHALWLSRKHRFLADHSAIV